MPKFQIVIEVEAQANLKELVEAWITNQLDTKLEVFNPFFEEDKVGEICIENIVYFKEI